MKRWTRWWPCILAFWPGLPRLWRIGSVGGLACALVFAYLLQLAVVTTLIWPESVSPGSRCVVWFCVLGFWLVFAASAFGRAIAGFMGGFSRSDTEHLFQTAQREYLRGNWYQTERPLRRLLELDAGDVDARLMLSSLYRHAGRYQAAKEQLDYLAESHGSEKWSHEMDRERTLLAGLRESSSGLGSSDPYSKHQAAEAA